jgi:predicted dehydrogenase
MRVVIIGLGKMGRYHLNACKERKDIDIVCLCDTVNTISKNYDMVYNYKDIPLNIDKVIIATPTATHYEIARYFLNHGIDTFVEKPATSQSIGTKVLLQLAKDRDAQFMVGHIENFNPVFKPLKNRIKTTVPILVNTTRLGCGPRITDCDVVKDLMIHDIALMLDLFSNGKVIFSKVYPHRAEAIVRYDNVTVVHRVDRLSTKVERKISITTEKDTILADLLSKKIGNVAYPGDALRNELDAFLNGHSNGWIAYEALKICEEILCQKKKE